MKSRSKAIPAVFINAGINKKVFTFKGIIALVFASAFIFTACNRDWQYLKSTHFNIRARSDIAPDKVKKLDKVLEDNYTGVGQFLKTVPDSLIQVSIYSHQWQYDLATGDYDDVGSVDGTSDLHFILQAWDEKQIAQIAISELTHAFTLKLLINHAQKPIDIQKFRKKVATIPGWLLVGISAYEANEFIDPKTLPFMRVDSAITVRRLNSQKIMKVGYTMIEYFLQKYGHDKLIELVVNYGDTNKVLGITDDQFIKDWYVYAKTKYFKDDMPKG